MGELVSPLILTPDPKQMSEGNRLCVLRPGTTREWQRTGEELQCRGMAVEEAKAQGSDRRETMTFSQNVNSDLKCVYFCGEILTRGTQPNSKFLSADCTAGQETQNLHPLI